MSDVNRPVGYREHCSFEGFERESTLDAEDRVKGWDPVMGEP